MHDLKVYIAPFSDLCYFQYLIASCVEIERGEAILSSVNTGGTAQPSPIPRLCGRRNTWPRNEAMPCWQVQMLNCIYDLCCLASVPSSSAWTNILNLSPDTHPVYLPPDATWFIGQDLLKFTLCILYWRWWRRGNEARVSKRNEKAGSCWGSSPCEKISGYEKLATPCDYILQLSTGSLTQVCVLQSLRTTTQVPNMVVS